MFYVENKRYYSCWLCKQIWEGRDDDLKLVLEDPRKNLISPVEEKEQEDESSDSRL
jgi:hypothetical protein